VGREMEGEEESDEKRQAGERNNKRHLKGRKT